MKKLFNLMITIILSMIILIPSFSLTFAQTGIGVTTTYDNMPVNHVRIISTPLQSAEFSTNGAFTKIGNWEAGREGNYMTVNAIVYHGGITYGSKNRSDSQNASLHENVIPGSFTLRYRNAALTNDGQYKDVLLTISDVRIFVGKKPNGGATTVYFPIIWGTTWSEYVDGNLRSGTTNSSIIKSSTSCRYLTTVRIVEPGTNTNINSRYATTYMEFKDLDVKDNTLKSLSYDGRFSEGIGLISGFSSPYKIVPGAWVTSQYVDGVQKVRGSQTSDGDARADVVVAGSTQGFSYYWYGSRKATSNPGNMGTNVGLTPTVTVTATAGTGGTIEKQGVTQYGINMPTSYKYTPNPGWVVKKITVNGAAQAINSSNLHGGTYTFSKLTRNSTIDVQFEPPQVEVTKVADKTYYQKGDIVTYTIKLRNKTGLMTVSAVKEQVNEMIQDAETLLADSSPYTDESVQALRDAVNRAKTEVNNPNATVESLRTVMNDLSDAISGLKEKESPLINTLKAKIIEAKNILNNGQTYTEASRIFLEDQIAYAENLVSPSDAEIYDAIDKLNTGIERLKVEGEADIDELLEELSEKMDEAELILNNSSDYPDETIQAVQNAYDAADELVSAGEDTTVSADDLTTAINNLSNAIADAKTYEQLFNDAMTSANDAIESGNYTDESVEVLQLIVDNYTNTPPTDNDARKTAIDELNTAINNLVLKNTSGTNNNTNNTNNSIGNTSLAVVSNLFSRFATPKTSSFSVGMATTINPNDYPGTYDTNVVLTEELPKDLQMIGYKVSGGKVEAFENKLTFSVDILADQEYTMEVKARVVNDKNAPFDVTNTVLAKGDISPEDATAQATITIVKPELEVKKVADKAKYHKNDTIHYTITVKNIAEHSRAENTVISDPEMSAGQTLVPGSMKCSDSSAVIDENNKTVTVLNIPGGSSVTVEYDATLKNDAIVSKDITNTAKAVCDLTLDEPKQSTATSTMVYDVSYEWVGDHPDKPVPAETKDIPWGSSYDVDTTYVKDMRVKDVVNGQKGSWWFNGWDHSGTLTIKDDLVIKGSWRFIPEYDIITEVENGTITDSEYDIIEGENRVISYSPNPGYQLKTLTVDGEDKNIKEYPGSYTFNDIHADHTVKAVFELIPKLEVIKESDKKIYNAGDTVTYTITINQTVEGAESRDVSIKDTMPDGLTLNEDSIQGDVEIISTSPHSYELLIKSLKTSVTYTYTAVTEKDIDHEELINVVDAESPNTPEPGNDDNTVKSLTPKPEIAKVVSNENPIYGEEITYFITVKEPQEGIELRNAKISDKLPEGVKYTNGEITIIGDESTAEIKDNEFIASIPILSNEVTFSFKVKVTAVEGQVDNIAILTGDDIKPIQDNAIFTVKEPNPTIVKEAGVKEASVGDIVPYTFTVTSDIPLYDAVIEDKLPEGLELIKDSVKCSDIEAVVEVKDDSILIKKDYLAYPITVTYDVKVKAAGEHKNVVTLTAFNFPKGPISDDATITGFNPKPLIEKTVSPETVNLNDKAKYTITVRAEKGTIYNAVIEDMIPEALELDPSSITVSDNTAIVETSTKTGTTTNNLLNFLVNSNENTTETTNNTTDISNTKLVVKLDKLTEEPVVIEYTATVKEMGTHENIATISGENVIEPAQDNANVSVREANPTIEKVASKNKVNVGEEVIYTVTVNSDIPLVDATIEDALPDGIKLIKDSITCSDPNANISTSITNKNIVITNANIESTMTITYKAKVTSAGEHDNTVSLTAKNFPNGPITTEATVEGIPVIPVRTGDSLPIMEIFSLLLGIVGLTVIFIKKKYSL